MRVKKLSAAFLAVSVISITGCSQKNPLQKYGVEYEYHSPASPNLVDVEFSLNTKEGKKPGPEFIADNLVVEFVDLDKDGVEEIIATNQGAPTHRAVAKLLIKDGVATGFHIVESQHMGTSFSEEGYYCP